MNHQPTPDPTVAPYDWSARCAAVTPITVSVSADSFLHVWPTYSGPAEFLCSDGSRYVIKAIRKDRNIAKAMFNDQIIARLGLLLQAPVGQATLIDLPQALIDINPQINYMNAGPAHATVRIPDVTERNDTISFGNLAENKSRYANLSILYWMVGSNSDRQFIYGTKPPQLIYSVDHGHFFPGGPDWTSGSLDAHVAATQPSADIAIACGLVKADYEPCCSIVSHLTENDLVTLVMAPPLAWGVSAADRIAIATFLWRQRDAIVTYHQTVTAGNP